jgi:hypothetical protein
MTGMTYLALDLRTAAEIAILMALAREPNHMLWRVDFGESENGS